MAQTVEVIRRNVEQQSQFVARLRSEIGRVIVGQEYMIYWILEILPRGGAYRVSLLTMKGVDI